MTFRNVILDLDGTLVDSFADIYRALVEVSIELKVNCPREPEVRKLMHLRLDQQIEALFPESDQDFAIRRFRVRYDRAGYPETRPYCGVESTILEMKKRGCHIFVATNKRKVAAEKIIARLMVEGAIEIVISSDVMTPPLDKTGQVKKIIVDYSLHLRDTVLVGDTLGDREAAQGNHISFIHAAYGYGCLNLLSTKCDGDRAIFSFPELLQLL